MFGGWGFVLKAAESRLDLVVARRSLKMNRVRRGRGSHCLTLLLGMLRNLCQNAGEEDASCGMLCQSKASGGSVPLL